MGFGYSSGPFSSWYASYHLYINPGYYTNIVQKAFQFGALAPKAKLKGFVYFPIPDQKGRLYLHVMEHVYALQPKKNR
ncbi:MAG: hypothetical protein D6674_08340 [Acidobacteria bacterium]|nr:MAG: hypothetical protein D6674_08340 [Acidobacteriota bacterium]